MLGVMWSRIKVLYRNQRMKKHSDLNGRQVIQWKFLRREGVG